MWYKFGYMQIHLNENYNEFITSQQKIKELKSFLKKIDKNYKDDGDLDLDEVINSIRDFLNDIE